MTHRPCPPAVAARSVELRPDEALRLLGTVPLGRIVFLKEALPTVRLVHHVLDDGDILFRFRNSTALTAQAGQANPDGVVVAFHADDIGLGTGLRWSVVVTGHCRLVTGTDRTAHCRTASLPCVEGPPDHVARIHPALITGIRLQHGGDTPSPF